MKEILKVNNLIKKFPKAGGEIDDADAISVLKGINFDVEQGEYVGIMGKSGCGKTTLLKILGFMDQQIHSPTDLKLLTLKYILLFKDSFVHKDLTWNSVKFFNNCRLRKLVLI